MLQIYPRSVVTAKTTMALLCARHVFHGVRTRHHLHRALAV